LNSFTANTFLTESLEKRKQQKTFRTLVNHDSMVDFCSNDYLGFAQSSVLAKNIQEEYDAFSKTTNGSGGSRLLAGNSAYAEQLEKQLAVFHNAEAALLYNSGYDANVGLFSAIAHKGHTVLYDELIHASVHDGMRLSKAVCKPFKHNDCANLEQLLQAAEGIVYVAVESIYSMDGECAHLTEIAALCEHYKANLIVDEAHATGVTPNGGKGKVQELVLENQVFARVHTFGKGLGCHGAIVVGSDLLRSFLINYSRSFIYTTALPLKSLMAINQAYLLLQKSDDKIAHLQYLIRFFKSQLSEKARLVSLTNDSSIQSIIISGSDAVKAVAKQLQSDGFDVRPIVSPTVAVGSERLRICIHAFNTKEEIEKLCKTINTLLTD
jgi:8-amino-7-oxononanoate synthase